MRRDNPCTGADSARRGNGNPRPQAWNRLFSRSSFGGPGGRFHAQEGGRRICHGSMVTGFSGEGRVRWVLGKVLGGGSSQRAAFEVRVGPMRGAITPLQHRVEAIGSVCFVGLDHRCGRAGPGSRLRSPVSIEPFVGWVLPSSKDGVPPVVERGRNDDQGRFSAKGMGSSSGTPWVQRRLAGKTIGDRLGGVGFPVRGLRADRAPRRKPKQDPGRPGEAPDAPTGDGKPR